MKEVKVCAPGKIMLSGEWSVLEGCQCIVLAIDKQVCASITDSKQTQIELSDFNITTKAKITNSKIRFSENDEKLIFTKHAIETTLQYLKTKKIRAKHFTLKTKSDISKIESQNSTAKPGFGSSAAATVAICAALLKFHGVGIFSKTEKEILFKLSIIAHYLAQGKIGSGFDIAASTFGGALVYKRFDSQWLLDQIKKKKIGKIVEQNWPLLEYRNITLPSRMQIVIGFSGKSASTKELVEKMQKFKTQKKQEYEKLIFWIREVTQNLIEALENSEEKEILTIIDENADILKQLGDLSGNELEIEEHRKMMQIASKYYAAAKFSGAGGGDCCIAVCFDPKIAHKIKVEWEHNDFDVIDAQISESGVRVR
ncbi:MAG TPA: phosphomevalonate kinase [archaeon]|nr:phosphomevalonate kinase [archaeon]